jgi:Domain of unknown function (DUF4105)
VPTPRIARLQLPAAAARPLASLALVCVILFSTAALAIPEPAAAAGPGPAAQQQGATSTRAEETPPHVPPGAPPEPSTTGTPPDAPTPPPPPPTPAARAALTGLLEKARALGLAADPHWLRLGHFHKRPGSGWQSEALQAGDFFLDPGGSTDPAGELDATLKALLGLTPQTPEELARGQLPAVCRFPARALFLQSKLGFDPALLQQVPCPRLEEFFRRLQPAGVALVFSSYYLNNPASAFGHTFLRVTKAGPAPGREKRELLDSAIDYAAQVGDESPVAYALKGLLGLFPGRFKLRPYYYKVREYNDYESRDLWEYELALSPLELAYFSAHLFELGSAVFAYYYVDENCSYQVLAALEAASPRLELLAHLGQPVVPADTLKALYRNPGLVQSVRYRPSATTQFEARVQGVDRVRARFIEGVSQDPALPLPPGLTPQPEVEALDAAADLIDIRFAKELTFDPEGTGPASRLKRALLARRAALRIVSQPLEVARPSQPQEAHDASRLTLGALYSDRDGPSAALGWRLALHSLDDPAGGYPDLAQIEFFPLEVRAQTRSGQVRLERLDFMDAVSLHAMTLFDHRLSWKLEAGLSRPRDGGCASCLAGRARAGTGATFAFGQLLLFATGDLSLQAGPDLDGISGKAVRAGAGPAGGARLRLGERVTLLVQGESLWYPGTHVPWSWAGAAALRVNLSPALGLSLEGRALPEAREGAARLVWFF